ncbi:MAG: urea transporter [Crocinitomicaceae bacterium]|nr:urea transporter [Crocinitomicaceae bacterium]
MKTSNKLLFVDQILKGIGQIMLQENSKTGLMFLIGLFVSSWKYGVALLLATIIGTLTARQLKFNQQAIERGLYGFSPALVGVALVFFFQSSLLTWVFIVLGAFLATCLQHFFIKKEIPVFTFPFIVVTWGVFYFMNLVVGNQQDLLSDGEKVISTYFDIASNLNNINISTYFDIAPIFKSFGQIIFQDNLLSSLLFIIGIAINSPLSLLYGLVASWLALLAAYLFSQPLDIIQQGVFGFNAILTAIALSGRGFKSAIFAIIGVTLTILIDLVLRQCHCFDNFGGVLTFPFVIATWIVLIFKKIFIKLND